LTELDPGVGVSVLPQGNGPVMPPVWSMCCLLGLCTAQPSAVAALSTLDKLDTELEWVEAKLNMGNLRASQGVNNGTGFQSLAGGLLVDTYGGAAQCQHRTAVGMDLTMVC
jgi:hypothetical protein